MTTREEFVEQAEELGRIMDELRPGTGPGIALLVTQAFDEGAKTVSSKAAEAPGGQLGTCDGYCECYKVPHRKELCNAPNSWQLIPAPAAPSERADERQEFNAVPDNYVCYRCGEHRQCHIWDEKKRKFLCRARLSSQEGRNGKV